MSNITTVTLAKFITPTTTEATSYTINFSNALFNPHSGHNADNGGIIASTGFFLDGNGTVEYFFDDDGVGNLRIYYSVAGVRVYQDETAGTVDYDNGKITVGSVNFATISNVDGTASSIIRITAVPDSLDVVPVRNQLLEIDFVNTTITGVLDTVATGDSSAGTSFTSTSSYTTPSGY